MNTTLKTQFEKAYAKRASRHVCGKALDEVIFYHWIADRAPQICYCFMWACEGVQPELKSTLSMLREQYTKFSRVLNNITVDADSWIALRDEANEFLLNTPDLGPYYEQINYWPDDYLEAKQHTSDAEDDEEYDTSHITFTSKGVCIPP